MSEQGKTEASSKRQSKHSNERVLIIGGGYGGLRAALRLARAKGRASNGASNFEIVLLDMNDAHQVITELHEVAGGRKTIEQMRMPFAKILQGTGVRFVQARVTDFDFANHRVIVETKNEAGESTAGTIYYRWLLLALGSTTAFYGIPGLKEHSYTLKSAWEAARVHQQVSTQFAEAVKLPAGSEERRERLTFVVGGGGFTGVELAGELAERIEQLCQQYQLARDEVSLLIIEAQAHLLVGYEDWMVEYAAESLRRQGVELLVGDPVAEVQGNCVMLKSGRRIGTYTLIWTGGVEAVSEAQNAGVETGRGGRVVVNDYLEAVEYPGVYAIGDNGLVASQSGQPLPPSAQLALQQADTVAANIAAEIGGHPEQRQPFVAKLAGEAISLGSHDALANIGGVKLTGFAATQLKNLIDQRYRLSLGNGPLAELAMANPFG